MAKVKAIALFSGGLDSTLAIKVVQEQGIGVVAFNFVTPFWLYGPKGGREYETKRAALELGVELKVINVAKEFMEVVKKPAHGYGRNLNPCIDCRILMLRKAKEWLEPMGASFLITGEVLGQRPMSQHRAALQMIEKDSGLEGLILRPLSAQQLPLTIPEKEGEIDRSRLLALSGRSRKPQITMAQDYGINDYLSPAGGCLLTDSVFARRMRDLLHYSELSLPDVELLKVGRHFRLSPGAKLIVGRDEKENHRLMKLAKTGDFCLEPSQDKGPTGIGRGDFDQVCLSKASQIIARYCDNHLNGEVEIASRRLPDEKAVSIRAKAIEETELQTLRI